MVLGEYGVLGIKLRVASCKAEPTWLYYCPCHPTLEGSCVLGAVWVKVWARETVRACRHPLWCSRVPKPHREGCLVFLLVCGLECGVEQVVWGSGSRDWPLVASRVPCPLHCRVGLANVSPPEPHQPGESSAWVVGPGLATSSLPSSLPCTLGASVPCACCPVGTARSVGAGRVLSVPPLQLAPSPLALGSSLGASAGFLLHAVGRTIALC